jgi:PIN domain nuclease of toxin-antitoxin system
MIFIDTHIAVLLANKQISKLSPKSYKLIESEEIYISPISLLELHYLFTIGRIKQNEDAIFSYLKTYLNLQQSSTVIDSLILAAKNLEWTRDLFDRLIVADCIVNGAPLITKDGFILEHYSNAVWD